LRTGTGEWTRGRVAIQLSRRVRCVLKPDYFLPLSLLSLRMNVRSYDSFPDPRAESWPPKDPNPYPPSDPNHVLTLPSSPWTYENGSFNPYLQPNSMVRRASSSRRGRTKAREPIASVPPYHPDYRPPGDDDAFSDSKGSVGSLSDEDEDTPLRPRTHIRQGSEGYEVRPIDREEMLRRHVLSQVHEPGRYNMYVPDTPSTSEDEDEVVPLADRVESWRSATGTEA